MRLLNAIRCYPCATLLAVQLASILVYPFFGQSQLGRSLFSLVGLVALVLAIYAVRETPALSWISVLIGAPLVVLTVWEALAPNLPVSVASGALHAVFYFYTCYAMVRYMFDDDVATVDEVWATGAAFTVLAFGFAYAYTAIQALQPGSFSNTPPAGGSTAWNEMLFMSITVLTSTGMSDILPMLPHSRSLVMIEQIAGMLYLALVVARIGALIARRRPVA